MNNKFLNAILALFLVLPVSFVLSSCSDDDDEPVNVVGEWEASVEYGWMELDIENGVFEATYCDEDEDGTDLSWVDFSGTYTVTGNNIAFKITRCDDPDEYEMFAVGTVLNAISDGNTINLNVDGVSFIFSR